MKAPDAFRTISEVAEELELPQHVLRFWETRFNQIKPMKRGGGRRYYRPEDIDLLRGIRVLLYGEGFTIRGVQRLLKDKGAAFVAGVGQAGFVQTVGASGQEATARTRRAAAERIEPQMEDRSGPKGGDRVEPFLGDSPFASSADDEAPDAAEEAEATNGSEDDRQEAARVVTPQSAPASAKPVQASGLSTQNRRRLEFTLADLEEAKRLLDQVR
jgi:DNA-binding transcriptional MerR regulator